MKVLAALALTVCAAGPLAAQATDDRAVALAVVQQLFDAMRTKDTTLMRTLFVPGVRIMGVRPRREGGSVLQETPTEQFAGVVARAQGTLLERIFDPEIRIDGTLASVWAPYDFHFNGTFSHCGVDAVLLLKVDGVCKIVALADSFQREGCPSRPAP